MREEAGNAQEQHPFADLSSQSKIAVPGPDDSHVAEVPDGQGSGCDLTKDRGHRRAHHTPPEVEDKERVQNDIDDCAQEGGDHGKLGIPVRPDDGVHGLPEHIEGNAQGDAEEILLGVVKGLLIDRAAEHGDDGVSKKQINSGQHKTAGHSENDRIADAVFRFTHLASTETDADKGAAAVSYQNSNGQCHYGQGEDNGVGGVAVRAEIAGVGDKNLIHNVVKGAYQQGNNTGNGVFPHQAPDLFSS